MKLTCNRSELLDALQGVSRAVSTKSTIPALEGILFKCNGYTVTLTAYDLELAIVTTISAEIEDPLDLVINARLFIDMIRKMESDTVVLQTGTDLRLSVRGGNSRFNILGMPAADFPELVFPEADNRITVPCNVLRDMIGKTLYAVSTNDQKPVHTGTKFIFENDSLTLASVDGFRLALARSAGRTAENDSSFVVPGRTLSEISHLIGDSESTVEISTARRYAIFTIPEYTVVTRLLEGDFLDFSKSIPTGYTTRIRVKVQSFYDAVERAALIISDRFRSPLRMRFEDQTISISCSTPLGNSHDVVDCSIEGDAVEIGFNNKYILEALRYSGSEEVFMELSGALSPVKLLPVDGSDAFLFLILPVRIKANE